MTIIDWTNTCKWGRILGPLYTQAKGHVRVVVRPFDLSTCHTIDTVYHNFRQAHLQEVGLKQISADHETLFIIGHVEIHVDFSSMIISLDPQAFTF